MNTTSVTMAAEYAISQQLYTSSETFNDVCLLNFANCVTVPFLHATIAAWYSMQVNVTSSGLLLQNQVDIASRMPVLACTLVSFIGTTSKEGEKTNHVCDLQSSKNQGMIHSTTQGWTYIIKMKNTATNKLSKTNAANIQLSSTNATLSTAHSGLRYRGTVKDVNQALFDLTYVTRSDWNSRMYGNDVLTFKVYDATTNSLFTTGTIAINVQAVNDAPIVSVPLSTVSTTEDFTRTIAGITIMDVDAEETYR